MKIIDLTLPQSLIVGDANNAYLKTAGYAGFFKILLESGLSTKFHNGQVPVSKGRIYARIEAKLEEMKPTEESIPNQLHVEEAEYDLIKSVFLDENTTFPLPQHQIALAYAEAIEAAK